jgi:hypothetical protein
MTDEIQDTIDTIANDEQVNEISVDNAEIVNEPESSTGEETKPADDRSAAPKKNRVQERIDELTRQKKDMEREAAYWRSQVEKKQAESIPDTPPVKPTLEAYNYDVTAFDAAIERYAEQTAAYKSHLSAAEERKRNDEIAKYRAEQEFSEKSSQFAAKTPDFFVTVQNPNLRITAEMAEAIKLGDNGPEIAYFLGKNPALAERIAALDERRQYLEIGRLHAEIAARTLPKVEQSKAPAPIKPVGVKASVQKDPSTMTDKEFAQWRRSHKRR